MPIKNLKKLADDWERIDVVVLNEELYDRYLIIASQANIHPNPRNVCLASITVTPSLDGKNISYKEMILPRI